MILQFYECTVCARIMRHLFRGFNSFVASVMAAQAQKESAKAVAAASSSVVEEEEECFGPIPIAKLEVSFLSV